MDLKIVWNFKKSEPIDLETFLTDFLRVRYNEVSAENLRAAVKAVHALRLAAIPKTHEKEAPNIEKIAEYFFCLKILEPLINSQEGQNFVRTTWYDSSKKSFFSNYKRSDLSLSFEIVNVLHMLGCAIWKKAEDFDRNDPSLIKTRINLFQLAAAAFDVMRKTVVERGITGMLSDITAENAEILSKICLIRAQMGFVSKCKIENKSEFLLRMVLFNYETSKSLFDLIKKSNIDKNIETVVHILYLYNAVEFNFYQYEEDMKNRKFGLSVFRLKVAFDAAQELNKIVNNQSSKELMTKAKSKLDVATKENDLIYHEKVPTAVADSDVKPLQVATLPELTKEAFNIKSSFIIDNFRQLVPGIVRNATKLFLNRKIQDFSAIFYSVENSDSLISNVFAELNIPAIFENQSQDTLPNSINEKCQILRSSDGLAAVLGYINTIENSRQNCRCMIDEARTVLRNEEVHDSKMSSKYPGNWNRKNSSTAASSWRECLDKYQNFITSAQTSDGILVDQFKAIKPSLELLMSDTRTIQKLLASKNDTVGRMSSKTLSDLQSIYKKLTNIQQTRKNALKAIEMKESDVDMYFLNQISSDGTLDVEAACQKLIDSFDPQVRIINKTINDQSYHIDKLISYNDSSKTSGRDSPKLDTILKHYDIFITLKKGIKEGVEFYRKLDANLKQLLSNIRDFSATRMSEAEELVQCIQNSRASSFQQAVYPSYASASYSVYPTTYANPAIYQYSQTPYYSYVPRTTYAYPQNPGYTYPPNQANYQYPYQRPPY